MGQRLVRKIENLDKLIQLLLTHPKGLRKIEIARRLGVHRSTAAEYLDDLTLMGVPVYEPTEHHFSINRDLYQFDVSLTLHESMAIHLASRLLATRTDKHNPHAASAIRKVGIALEELAPLISKHLLLSANTLESPIKKRDPIYLQVLETLTKAWASGIKVHLTHEMPDGEIYDYTFSPYFIEPYAVGRTSHVIGLREPPSEIRTFKIERIRTIELLEGETYSIPDDFDPSDQLRDAWGIWYTEEQTTTVKLKFKRDVAKRVQETQWHHSQEVRELEDGSLLWTVKIAEPQEMVPWIRGWGADVEVLAPPSLQKEIRSETRKLMHLYLGDSLNIPPYYKLWAKAQPKGDEFHPLLYHLIDVGVCAKTLWDASLSAGFKKRMTQVLPAELNEEETGNLLAFLAATHDIGKASPSFQQKHQPSIERIKAAGFEFPPPHGQTPTSHGIVSAWALTKIFKEIFSMESYDARRFAHALGGHHGILPATNTVNRINAFDKGDEKWDQVRLKLIQEVQNVFTPPDKILLPDNIEEQNMFLMLLLGLTTTADWLGSDERFFDYEDRFLQPKDYADAAKEKAQNALAQTGWREDWQASGELVDFGTMFPSFTPRKIQAKVIEIAEDLPFPSLTILEAPTGIGKTEAALYLADTWLQKEQGRGLYIAMPTQATSNQIFERTLEFLDNRYDQKINIQLAHGQAQWNEKMQELRLTSIGEGPTDTENKMRAEAWFTPRKKTLLAPFGVGTVDQALMSTIQTRHFYLRLFGLANKVVIFDEVHAYDTYMSKLFLRLLAWLRAVGSSVIVLSATLPEKTRQEMIKIFAQKISKTNNQTHYPRLSLVSPEQNEIIELPVPADCSIQLVKLDPSPESTLLALENKLAQGGCAAVICNTVRRAQEIYTALQHADFIPNDNLTLFHSRFPPAWRKGIEEKVLKQFGKNGERPDKGIVVATQVIEQSLDLDFDLMVSDLAPVDLLIQRIGRLHRHRRDARPPGLLIPQLLIIQPQGEPSTPDFGGSSYVYETFILWLTWLILENRTKINLPSETNELIEAVYGEFKPDDFTPEIAKKLKKAQEKMLKAFRGDVFKAEQNLIPHPNTENLVTSPMQDLKDDEDPALHEQLKAVTRLIPPGVNLVCLHKMVDGTLNTEPDGTGKTIDLKCKPKHTEVEDLLRHTVSLHQQQVIEALADKTSPTWKRITTLRYYVPLIFEQSRCPIEETDITLILSKELGLQVEKETL